MRTHKPLASALAALLMACSTLSSAAPNALAGPSTYPRRDLDAPPLLARDGHVHMKGPPLTELNETLIAQWHPPTPPSYATHDYEDTDVEHRYPYLMGLHVATMSLAFFGALPIGIALRSVNHGLHGVSVAVFWAFVILGLSFGGLYRKNTPNMYEGQKHSSQGYFVVFFALVLTTIDGLSAIYRAVRYFVAVRRAEVDFSIKGIWKCVVLNKENEVLGDGLKTYDHEYTGLVIGEPEEIDLHELDTHQLKGSGDMDHVDLATPGSASTEADNSELWKNNLREMHRQRRGRTSRWGSVTSDGTLFATHDDPVRRGSDDTLHELPHHIQPVAFKIPLAKRIGRATFAVAERVLVFLGYMQVITGGVVYTGICRDSWVNGCLAHLIKGGIFWCYGLLTFGRFLGAFSEVGWAWNIAPKSNAPSAEFVESLVIFLYGISNTWMERFGITPGSPFSTKQIQHISIAVMFWFAGLVGMGIESKRIRNWLAMPAAAMIPPATLAPSGSRIRSTSPSSRSPPLPPSYRASFNPFPALVIGITGLAMAAHAQVYLFQVQIHSLWGQLLAGFALLRCLTYFFLFLSPPISPLPSRPPSEALAAFFLACGGLVFQSSTEEISIAAMRRGHDDVMMFLNVAVAMTCLSFCWVGACVTFKAWLKVRQMRDIATKRGVHVDA